MQEQLLHFIWHRRLFSQGELKTTEDHPVEILQTGTPNRDQGPDFLQSRIRIGDHIWAGHVEIHVRSSEWYMHKHDQDTHYNNVILHVVWTEDQPVFTMAGTRIPCIELAGRVDRALLDRYHHLMNNEEWVPCASSLSSVASITRTSWLERLMSERLESKTDAICKILEQCGNDWEQAFFVVLARQLGAPANSDAMENLGLQLPLKILRRHGDRTDQMEAILFGVAGMLMKEMNEGYPASLKKEFDFLRLKYGLQPMPALRWKFMRMRPVHFPTIRLAQLAKIIADAPHFISMLTEVRTPDEWIKRFMVVPDHAYWDDHYHFKNDAPPVTKRLGKDTAQSLVINLVAPFMFVYGKMHGTQNLKERAVQLLCQMPAEKNAVIKNWEACGWKAEDAGQSQAMLHLKKNYCDVRRCLHCAIGLKVMSFDRPSRGA
ncbi:MAG TPA: DUF2851 family protein [Saprospiraceae bacterium]|nr:DUF2851 family protein [Saprospiraceae bacterium]